jgi:PBP1b-binding outer membrane lipoprotein LpoB
MKAIIACIALAILGAGCATTTQTKPNLSKPKVEYSYSR